MERVTERVLSSVISLPQEIMVEILTRLPAKSLCRFKSVSPFCSAIMSEIFFINDHLARSPARPSLIFSFHSPDNSERLFYSANQEGEESVINAVHQLTLPGFLSTQVSQSFNGLICANDKVRHLIFNPGTMDFTSFNLKLEDVVHSRTLFGFDPRQNVHKALNASILAPHVYPGNWDLGIEFRIFTLGSDAWRKLEGVPHHIPPLGSVVCINGTIFYITQSIKLNGVMRGPHLVAFDVGAEVFRAIRLSQNNDFPLKREVTLIDFCRNLCIVDYECLSAGMMTLRLLEDSDRGIWSERIILLPEYWRELVQERKLYVAGTIYTGEILLAPVKLLRPFYLFYYDVRRNRLRRVEICGLPEHELSNLISFTNHVDSLLPAARGH